MNISEAEAQIGLLKQQSAAASHIARVLDSYQNCLQRSWSGIEVNYLCQTIDDQIRACEKLCEDTDRLSSDMVRAMEEILLEEGSADGMASSPVD